MNVDRALVDRKRCISRPRNIKEVRPGKYAFRTAR